MEGHITEVSTDTRCIVSEQAGDNAWFSPYKDLVAKSAQEAAEPKRVEPSSCGKWCSHAGCSAGHHFAKKLLCNQEWCKLCGQDDSAAHKRRQARILPKIQQLKVMGQVVIEFPEAYRRIGKAEWNDELGEPEGTQGWCYSKAALRRTGDIVLDILAGERSSHRGRTGGFFPRGVLRWHYFGEVCIHSQSEGKRGLTCEITGNRCPKRKCDKFVNNGNWNPHINALVDGGHLDKVVLESLKAALRDCLGVADLIVNYSYMSKPGKMVHAVRYITRPTFKERSWDNYMADELYNFRNIRCWGKWKDEPVWELEKAEAEGESVSGLEAVGKLQEHVCPDCGAPLAVRGFKMKLNHKSGEHEIVYDRKTGEPIPVYWSKAFPSLFLEVWRGEEIGETGYYRIPRAMMESEPEGERVPLAELRRTNARLIARLREEAKSRKENRLEDG